jgi:hypothetical protein
MPVVEETKKPVRDWMDSHPVTTIYIAVMVTALFVLQIVDLITA